MDGHWNHFYFFKKDIFLEVCLFKLFILWQSKLLMRKERGKIRVHKDKKTKCLKFKGI